MCPSVDNESEKASIVIRNIFLRLMPGRAAEIEQQSRSWIVECPKCGHKVSVWDSGGIRYKARGKPRRYGRCVNCRQRSWLRLYQKQGE
jgi:DNA-directed RNA polymerase subunit M/transcription elongation factor TFIIS